MFLKVLKIFIIISLLIFLFLFSILFYLLLCKEKAIFNEKEAVKISYSPLVQIVPSDKIPADLRIYKSNNNLDIVRYKNRYYFAFRTAPTHFASKKAVLYVLSSDNSKNWEYETEINLKSDLREPRFLVFKDKLFLYFFKGGTNPLSFAPEHIFVSKFISKSNWLPPKPIYKPGFVVWRAKEFKGKAYMSVYYGVGLYSNENMPTHLQLLESNDGYNYKLVNGREISTEVSAEEGEFEFIEEGNLNKNFPTDFSQVKGKDATKVAMKSPILYATIRMEMKGGKVCYALKEDITNWHCKYTPYKYDSALMFRHKDDFYVIARRNVDGKYNKGLKYLPKFLRSKFYLVRYSLTRKRTTLYKLHKEKLELEPLFDFPSRGDTAYAGITKISENKYLVLNYSSDIHGFDWNWLGGQLAGSNIYATILEFK